MQPVVVIIISPAIPHPCFLGGQHLLPEGDGRGPTVWIANPRAKSFLESVS